MSSDEDLKICQKRRYETIDEAKKTIAYLILHGKAERGELGYYKCHICHQFHLTSKIRRYK
jgi:hypothetical protein